MNYDANAVSRACSRPSFLFDELPSEQGAEPGSTARVCRVLGIHRGKESQG